MVIHYIWELLIVNKGYYIQITTYFPIKLSKNMQERTVHIDPIQLRKEVHYKMSRSSGNGGQHVNKVSTKASLYFPIDTNQLFTSIQKEQLKKRLKNRITKDGFLVVTNQEARSAEKNKKAALKILVHLLQKALTPQKGRKKSSIPKSAREQRLVDKKRHAEKKAHRKKQVICDSLFSS